MRSLIFLLSLFLLSSGCWAQSTTGGPLQISGELMLGAQVDPYCPGSGIQPDRATRVRVDVTNPTNKTIRIPRILGTFFDGNGERLHLDRQALTVGPGKTESVFLYYNNFSGIVVSSVLVAAEYRVGREAFVNQVAVNPTPVGTGRVPGL